ncbi:Alpha C protein N terminal [Flavobacterium sp. CF108]|uniref:hypothetical protein n=1 Tax=Flavobacterium sp. CF108 TaxID=1882758 RepID=UPI0009184B0A|nr:hypothetical protein [Flavobacterium sp. CF108]SHH92901.1 Alpha C protein N terminal [Flavobacterium sp. CF108]
MKQTEKLDLLLRELYKHKFDGHVHSLTQICEEKDLPIEPHNEVRLLAHRLIDDGFITGNFTLDDCLAEITSYGVEYCEDDSYTYKGSSLITNNYISISNSPNSNIVSESKNVTINFTNYSSIKGKISEIKDAINSATLDDETRTDLLDCLEEVETSIDAGKKPKFSMKQLIEIGANVSGITSLIVELSQLL